MNDAMSAADDRTLRLAAPDLTGDTLDRFIAFAKAMAHTPKDAAPAVVAKAHADALAQSGLLARDLAAVEAVCRDFTGRRAVVNTLRLQLQTAEGERRATIEKELSARSGDASFERRYGKEVLRILQGRERELMALHQDAAPAVGRS